MIDLLIDWLQAYQYRKAYQAMDAALAEAQLSAMHLQRLYHTQGMLYNADGVIAAIAAARQSLAELPKEKPADEYAGEYQASGRVDDA